MTWVALKCIFSSVQSLSRVQLFATPWTAAHQASPSITNPWSPPEPMSIESMMPSNHLIRCHPLLLLPSIPPSIRVFSNELALHIQWQKYWSFSFNISPSNEHPGLISFRHISTCFEPSLIKTSVGLPWWLSGKESACWWRKHGFDPSCGKIPHAVSRSAPEPQLLKLRSGAWGLQTLKPACSGASVLQCRKPPP